METDGPPRKRSLSQQEFFDIYLVAASKETSYFQKMKELIHRNGWKMTSLFESKLGLPVSKSIENDILNSSHVVYLIASEDNEKGNENIIRTIDMAFASPSLEGVDNKVIPVFCCDKSSVSLDLKRLPGESIDDEALERRLRISIDVSIRKKREQKGEYPSVLGSAMARLPSKKDDASVTPVSSRTTDELLLHVAKCVPTDNVVALSVALGFNQGHIQRYVVRNDRGPCRYEGTLVLLHAWTKRHGNNLQDLFAALEEAGIDVQALEKPKTQHSLKAEKVWYSGELRKKGY